MTRNITRLINNSDLVSYGNRYMQYYVEREIGVKFGDKCFESPDLGGGNKLQHMHKPFHAKRIFTFFGNIYGGRNPYPLFEALKEISQKQEVELRIYSSVSPEIIEKYPFVREMSYVKNIMDALAEADVLVDIDGDDKHPVFISSKLKDYLLIDRPILSITPLNSPSRELLHGFHTARVSLNRKEDITLFAEELLNLQADNTSYDERKRLISFFSPEVVSREIEKRMKNIINKRKNEVD